MSLLKQPLVSVVIPVYNVRPYIHESLDSVVNQTYEALEIILVDDGSTDGSGSICDEYKSDPRIKVVHQRNCGLSMARNVGLDRMTGEYVAFLDSDDVFNCEMIERMVEGIQETAADLIACGYDAFKANEIINGENRSGDSFHFKRDEMLSSNEAINRLIAGKLTVCVWDKLYRKELWENIRFPEGRVYEDIWVALPIMESCSRVALLSHSYVIHRYRKNSITHTYTEKNIEDHISAINMVDRYIMNHENINENSRCNHIANATRILCDYYAKTKTIRVALAEQCRKEAMRYWSATDKQQIRTKTILFLLVFIPCLVLPARACWLIVKRLKNKIAYG